MKKHCCRCGKKVIGRTDKKFCDALCKNTYHNDHRKRRNLELTIHDDAPCYGGQSSPSTKHNDEKCEQM